jgi:antitoxin-like ribbon-helix-helix protein
MPKPKRSPLTFDPDKKNTVTPAAAERHVEETVAPKTAVKAKGRQGRQFIAAHVVPEAAKQFKLLAVQQDRTTQDLLVEAINDLFAKYGLSRIADE